MLFFYPEKLDSGRLRHALVRVLGDFSQYAGKLLPEGTTLQIQHGGRAVSFESVESNNQLNEVASELRATGRCRELEPKASTLRVALARERTLLVRLTSLRDGCVLGVGWNHAVGDMQSTMLLMRAWASAYAGRMHEKPLMLTDRDAYYRAVLPDDPRARSVVRRLDLRSGISARLQLLRPAVQVRAEFSNAELRALQEAASASTRVSRNDALCSHVYAVLRRLSPMPHQTNLCLVVNFRKRLDLPEHVIGNMTSLIAQPVRRHHSAAHVAAGLRRKLDEYAEKHVHYHPTARAHRACTTHTQRLRLTSRQFRLGSGDIFITNWNGFGAYDLEFGESRPVYFHPMILGPQLPQWFMIIYELPDDGLAVTVALPKSIARRWTSREGQSLLHTAPIAVARERRALNLGVITRSIPQQVIAHRGLDHLDSPPCFLPSR
jgi:hypothetical protein